MPTAARTRRIEALEARRDAITRTLTEMDDLVIERGSDLDDAERSTRAAHEAELTDVVAELATVIAREEQIARSQELSAQLGPAANRNDGRVVVTADEPLYRQGGEHSFVDDVIARTKTGDVDAATRLGRWNQIERAAAASGDLAGLIVPQYLVNELVGLAKEGRPFLNTLRSRPIRGKSVVLPRIVTAPTTGAQDGENTAFATAALDTEEVTVDTKTVGGYTDLSVQSVEWPGSVDESWLFSTLLEDLYTRMDYLALWGTGANGQPEGLFNSDGTNVLQGDALGNGSAADKFGELYGVVRQGATLIRTQDKRNATHVLMSANRWGAISSALDSEGRPLLGWADSAPQNVGGTWTGPSFAGLPMVADENVVKDTEDDTSMAVYAAPSIYFAESEPKRLTCDCVVAHTGGVRFVIRAFMAFSAKVRPKSVTLVEDLPTPEFPTEGGLS